MTKQWEQGREQILVMIADGRLSHISPNLRHAELLINQARQHLTSALLLSTTDPEGGYVLAYDAARKALTAVLEVQGLRTSSSRGHHINLFEAVFAQLDPPMGKQLQPFNRMRRKRNEVEYPSSENHGISSTDVEEDVTKSLAIVEIAAKVLHHMPAFVTEN